MQNTSYKSYWNWSCLLTIHLDPIISWDSMLNNIIVVDDLMFDYANYVHLL